MTGVSSGRWQNWVIGLLTAALLSLGGVTIDGLAQRANLADNQTVRATAVLQTHVEAIEAQQTVNRERLATLEQAIKQFTESQKEIKTTLDEVLRELRQRR